MSAWELESGRLRFEAAPPLRVCLSGAAPRVITHAAGERITWEDFRLSGAAGTYAAEPAGSGLRVEVRLEPREDAWLLEVMLRNQGNSAVRIEEVAALALDGVDTFIGSGVDRWSVFRNGYQSWSGTRSCRVGEADRDPPWDLLRIGTNDLRHRSPGRPGAFRSDLFTVIKNLRSGEALCLGFLDARHAFSAVEIDASGAALRRIAAICDFDGVELSPGAALSTEPLWIACGFDELELLERYAAALGAALHARVPAKQPAGWCSWYYYFTRVSEAAVLENLGRLRALRERVPCDYVQVDDGYQTAIGDWLQHNEKFPHGMRWLAERIREAGFDAGIWIAPFIARKSSNLFRQHPDWFARTPAGKPLRALWNPVWGLLGYSHALDTTHPAVLEWLRSLARTLVHDWGYRLLKLDFLFAAALPGVRYDRTATRAAALRRGLEAIREGAGEGAFLLGCGCPLGPAVGVVDAMRIGPDVAPFWSLWFTRRVMRDLHGVATKHAIRNTLVRSFLHRRLWLNDPDCLMVRSTKTRLNADEVHSLAAAIALTDGMFVVSDRMDQLPPDRLQLLELARALTGGRARVVDLFERDMPELVLSEREEDSLIGAFNFDDRPRQKLLDCGRLGVPPGDVVDVWSRTVVPRRDGWLDLGEIPPHGCRVLRVPRVGRSR